MIKYVFWDLDGTLLPMDQDKFVGTYFGYLAKRLAPLGFEAQDLVRNVWGGTKAMVKNTSDRTNEQVFWEYFDGVYGDLSVRSRPVFEDFYANEFAQAREVCGFNPMAARTVEMLSELGIRQVLATNPVFPKIATRQRIAWAGLDEKMFLTFTTYENSRRCKPNPDYYRELMASLNIDPAQSLMVGNDAEEDTAAEQAGMRVFLLTACLINAKNRDISSYPQGTFADVYDYVTRINAKAE